LVSHSTKDNEKRENNAVNDAAGKKGCRIPWWFGEQTEVGLCGGLCRGHISQSSFGSVEMAQKRFFRRDKPASVESWRIGFAMLGKSIHDSTHCGPPIARLAVCESGIQSGSHRTK
jgi:hypothetical protein